MVELSRAIYSVKIYLGMIPKLTKEHTIAVKNVQDNSHIQLWSDFNNS